MASKKGGLGRGLDALFGDAGVSFTEPGKKEETKKPAKSGTDRAKAPADGELLLVDINDIAPNPAQPRKNFDEEKLKELADSIKSQGVIQPLVLTPTTGGYEIIAGERRWRAARIAGIKEVPCIVRELTEEQKSLLTIIENMQREDLDPIEEAEGLSKMAETYGLTHEQIAQSVSKSRADITNSLRLLKLPEAIRNMVSDGLITKGHARALLAVEDEGRQLQIAETIVAEDLSVRATEVLVKGKQIRRKPRKKVIRRSADIAQVERDLKDIFGTKVRLEHRAGKGVISIEYYSKDELERLIEMLRSLG
ncbi:MAG: ParB/RepB/Spo0J family partition protein [Firmicutes bacterium]|nr:ParB/RepB/Spo0J family partition protein [Bacillota bacterium]